MGIANLHISSAEGRRQVVSKLDLVVQDSTVLLQVSSTQRRLPALLEAVRNAPPRPTTQPYRVRIYILRRFPRWAPEFKKLSSRPAWI
jgi:hypothetical protein